MKTASDYYNMGVSSEKNNPEKAIEYYQKAIEIDADHISAYFGWGNVLLDMKDYDGAKEKYNKCLIKDPKYKLAYYNLGILYERLKESKKAIENYQKAIAVDANYIDAYNRWGEILLNIEDQDEAQEQFNKWLKIDSIKKNGFYYLGRLYEKSNPKKAIENYQKAIAIDVNYTDAYNRWGQILLSIEGQDKAREQFIKWLKIDSIKKNGYYYLGRLYEESDSKKAIENYQKAIQIDANFVEVYNSWGNVLAGMKDYDGAKEKYNKCLIIDPKYKLAYYNLGILHERLKESKKAIENYQKAIAIDANYTDAYKRWGEILLELEDYDEAQVQFNKWLEIDAIKKNGYYYLGRLYEESDSKKAIENYQKAIEIDADHISAYFGWGNVLLDMKDYDGAKEKYNKCLIKDPKYKLAYYNLGILYERLKESKKAIENYQKAIAVDANYIDAYNRWGEILLNIEDQDEAKEQFNKWLEIDAIKKNGYYYLGRLYEKSDPKKAIDYFQKATQEDPDYIAAYNTWGNVLLDMKDYDGAKEKYNKCLIIDPKYKLAYYNLGILYERLKESKKAIENYQKAIAVDANYIDAYKRWGEILLNIEDQDEAKEQFNKWLEIDAIKKNGYYYLGRLYEENDSKKAIENYEKAIDIDPKYINAYRSWGNVLLDMDDHEGARKKYQKCREIDPKYVWAYVNLAISFRNEDPEKSIRLYKKAIEVDKTCDNAYSGIYSCITLIKDNKGHIKEFQNLVEEHKSASGFRDLGNLYQYFFKDYEKSFSYYKKSMSIKIVKDVFLDLSNLYDATGNLKKSIEVLDQALEKNTEDIYALHNKAHFLFKMGNYQKSRELWRKVLILYDNALKSEIGFKKDSDNYFYYGSIYYEIFGNIDKAEDIFKQGLERNSKNIGLLVALNQLYADKDKRKINSHLSAYWKRNANLRIAENLLDRPFNFPYDSFKIVELYFLEESFEKGHSVINTYLSYGQPSARGYNLQGQLFLAQEEYIKSINSFKKAIRLDAHNFNLSNNLGNAFLRHKEYSSAEKEFKKVLKNDPNNVDALIGLSEINLNGPEDDLNDKLLEVTDKYLKDAIILGESGKGSKRLNLYECLNSESKERKYKNLKLSDLYYSRGYIKTKQYEKNKLEINNSYLKDGLHYFEKSLESNPDNIKAKTAIQKISKFIKSKRTTNKNERFSALLVCSMAFVLFVFCQYYFYFGSISTESFSLNEKNVEYLSKALSINKEKIEDIKKLEGVVFEDKNVLISEIKNTISQDQAIKNIEVLEKVDFKKPDSNKTNNILPAGYYALISFGSILFMIAGLYLRKLLKIKVGIIELEKNKPSTISDISLSGIEK